MLVVEYDGYIGIRQDEGWDGSPEVGLDYPGVTKFHNMNRVMAVEYQSPPISLQ